MTRRGKLIALWAAVAVLVVALVATGVFLFRAARADAATREACEAVTDLNTLRNDSLPVSEGDPVAVVLGDSYAQGQFLDDPREQAWSTLVARAEGWEAYVNAVGGTGVTSDGPCDGQGFAARVPSVLERSPSVVLVQAGLNDDPATARDAATDLLQRLAAVPTVVIIGPASAPAYDRASTITVDHELAAAAGSAGRQYISMLNVALEYGGDERHMTVKGHEAFAAAVLAAID